MLFLSQPARWAGFRFGRTPRRKQRLFEAPRESKKPGARCRASIKARMTLRACGVRP